MIYMKRKLTTGLILLVSVLLAGCLTDYQYSPSPDNKISMDVRTVTIDVGFLSGTYQTYHDVVEYKLVEKGLLSNTIDITTFDGHQCYTSSLHYVTPVRTVSAKQFTIHLTQSEYKKLKNTCSN